MHADEVQSPTLNREHCKVREHAMSAFYKYTCSASVQEELLTSRQHKRCVCMLAS